MKFSRFRRPRFRKAVSSRFSKKKYTWRTLVNDVCQTVLDPGQAEEPCQNTVFTTFIKSQAEVTGPDDLLPGAIPPNLAAFQDRVTVVRLVGQMYVKGVPLFSINPPADTNAFVDALALTSYYVRMGLFRRPVAADGSTPFYELDQAEDYDESRVIKSWEYFYGGTEEVYAEDIPAGMPIGVCADVSSSDSSLSDGSGIINGVSTSCTAFGAPANVRGIHGGKARFPGWHKFNLSMKKRIPMRENEQLVLMTTWGDVLPGAVSDTFGPVALQTYCHVKALLELS